MSNLFLRRWRHEDASNENVGESVDIGSPIHLPQPLAACVPQTCVVSPVQMQEDRSRSCTTSQHALICIFMPALVRMRPFLYLM